MNIGPSNFSEKKISYHVLHFFFEKKKINTYTNQWFYRRIIVFFLTEYRRIIQISSLTFSSYLILYDNMNILAYVTRAMHGTNEKII